MAKIEIDVDGVDKTLNKIKRDLHRGMDESADALVDNARDTARRVISEKDAIFNAEVYAGFKNAETGSSTYSVRKKLYNDVDHAAALEEGATYPKKAPPVTALLPWVKRKMDWNVGSGSNSDGGGSSGSSRVRESITNTEIVSQSALDEDTTDDGLTLSKQADDLSIEGGDLDGVDDRVSKRVLWELDRYQREYSAPKIDSIRVTKNDTLESTFDDDSNTISLPKNLIDEFEEFDNPSSTYIEEKQYFNASYENHTEYIVRHQYGTYLYDNLKEEGLY